MLVATFYLIQMCIRDRGQVFMTPQVDKENPTSLGVAKKEDKNGKACLLYTSRCV